MSLVTAGYCKITKERLPLLIIPACCLMTAYTYDAAFGSRQLRIRDAASRILLKESGRFILPEGNGLVTTPVYRKYLLPGAEHSEDKTKIAAS